MLKATTQGFEDDPLEGLTRYIQTLSDTLAEEALETAIQFEDALETIFNDAPPRRNSKFVWSLNAEKNMKAMGWWFWQLKLGNIPTDGKHYIRQNKPPRGGKVLVDYDGERIVIIFTTTFKKAGLLYGTLDGQDTRLPGHKTTGWELAYPKFVEARRMYLEALFNRVLNRRAERAGL